VKWRWSVEGGLKGGMAFQQLSFRKFSGFRVEFSVSGKSGWIVRKQIFLTGGQDSQGWLNE
jgi:hypothetical protein